MFSADVFCAKHDFPPKNGPVPIQAVNGCSDVVKTVGGARCSILSLHRRTLAISEPICDNETLWPTPGQIRNGNRENPNNPKIRLC